jgi:8-oxo-dGTP pyrophosphatase MutT (NUDIX family)
MRFEGESGMRFPVSVKGVLVEGGRVVLLLNERDEWELPGGRLERGEDPVACLKREFAEELGAEIVADRVLDCWLYQVLPGKEVLIVTYAVRRVDRREFRVSREHRKFGAFAVGELRGLAMPEGNRRSIGACAALVYPSECLAVGQRDIEPHDAGIALEPAIDPFEQPVASLARYGR